MDRVVSILIERDGNTEQEALERIAEVQSLMQECDFDPNEVECIIHDFLGLEPDYIIDLL